MSFLFIYVTYFHPACLKLLLLAFPVLGYPTVSFKEFDELTHFVSFHFIRC